MDLAGDIFRTRGRAAKPASGVVVRELTRDDLVLLGEERGVKTPALKRLGQRHHALARNLASGMADHEAAIIAGYSSSRISILKNDPAFCELLEFYRDDVKEQYRDLHQRLSGLALDATDELASRLEEEPEKFSVGQLMEAVKLGADRTGHGPTQGGGNVTNTTFVVALPEKAASAEAWSLAHSPRVIEHKDVL